MWDSIRITPDGQDALEAFEEQRKQESKAERDRRFQRKIGIANVLIPLVTFVLGLLVQYFFSPIR